VRINSQLPVATSAFADAFCALLCLPSNSPRYTLLPCYFFCCFVKTLQGLLELNLVPEEWGGNTPMVPISAKKGTGEGFGGSGRV
jgi:hypothetical protein